MFKKVLGVIIVLLIFFPTNTKAEVIDEYTFNISEKSFINGNEVKGNAIMKNNIDTYDFIDGVIRLKDDFGTYHYIEYKNDEVISPSKARLSFNYNSTSVNNKAKYIWINLYKKINDKMIIIESFYWNLEGSSNAEIYADIDYNKYATQDNLYFEIGLTKNVSDEYFFDSEVVYILNTFPNDFKRHWANKEIKKAMDDNWVNTSSKFRPNDSITRAEFIKIVNKALGFKTKAKDENFKDVNPNDWWYSEVLIALGNRYISTGNENFRPRDPITRQEVANIITTITKTKDNNLDKLNKYSDGHLVSESMKSSVEGSIEQGFMGVGSTIFNPKKNITRAEAIVTLNRVVRKLNTSS